MTMRTIRIITIVLATMMVAFFLWNLTLSGTYKAEISVHMDASSKEIRSEMNNLKSWENWATFLKSDTTLTVLYSTPSQGERAWISWTGVGNTGGRMEIIHLDSLQTELLISLNGFKGARSFITFTPKEEYTTLAWTVEGELPFYARFMKAGFEKRVSSDLIESTTELNRILVNQRLPKMDVLNPLEDISSTGISDTTSKEDTTTIPQMIEHNLEDEYFFYESIETKWSKVTLTECLAVFDELKSHLAENAINVPMVIQYDTFDPTRDYVKLNVGITMKSKEGINPKVKISVLPGGQYIQHQYQTRSLELHPGSQELDQYLQAHGFHMHGKVLELVRFDAQSDKQTIHIRYPVISSSEEY